MKNCEDCKKANSIFCSMRCHNNYMARRRYALRKLENSRNTKEYIQRIFNEEFFNSKIIDRIEKDLGIKRMQYKDWLKTEKGQAWFKG